MCSCLHVDLRVCVFARACLLVYIRAVAYRFACSVALLLVRWLACFVVYAYDSVCVLSVVFCVCVCAYSLFVCVFCISNVSTVIHVLGDGCSCVITCFIIYALWCVFASLALFPCRLIVGTFA